MNPISNWGQWDLNPRPPAPQANTSARLSNFNRDGILDQARRWPLRLRQRECFLNVVFLIIKNQFDGEKLVIDLVHMKSCYFSIPIPSSNEQFKFN